MTAKHKNNFQKSDLKFKYCSYNIIYIRVTHTIVRHPVYIKSSGTRVGFYFLIQHTRSFSQHLLICSVYQCFNRLISLKPV